jgi:zinc protease
MKRKKYLAYSLILLILFFSVNSFTKEEIIFPVVEKSKTANGLKVFYIKNELPKVVIAVSFGFGKLYENKGNAGISKLFAKTLSLAGSKKYPGEKLHKKIDTLGAKLNIISSWENTIISIEILDRYTEIGFNIISDLILNPNFEDKFIVIAKSIMIDEIKRKKDNPHRLAVDKAKEIIFNGEGYGAVPTIKNITSITKNDLKSIWSKYLVSKNTLMGISSPREISYLKDIVNKKFGSIKSGEQLDYTINNSKISSQIKKNSKKIYFIPKQVEQATIIVGSVAPDIHYENKYSLSLMNYILGGGSFNSRLMKEIRVKRGLAYSVWSVVRFRKNAGIFLAGAQTGNNSAEEVLSLIMGNIEKTYKEEIKDDELNWAKSSIKNSYIFNFDTHLNILNNFIEIEYNNLDSDYYKVYIDNIFNVNSKLIQNESRNLFKNGLIKVVLGKPELGEIIILK